jgi:hypothetical protein
MAVLPLLVSPLWTWSVASNSCFLISRGMTPPRFRNNKAVAAAWRTVTAQWRSRSCSLWLFCWQPSPFPAHLYKAFLAQVSLAAFLPAIFLYHLYSHKPFIPKQTPEILFCFKDDIPLLFSYRITKVTFFPSPNHWLHAAPSRSKGTTVISAWEEVALPLTVPSSSRQHSALFFPMVSSAVQQQQGGYRGKEGRIWEQTNKP